MTAIIVRQPLVSGQTIEAARRERISTQVCLADAVGTDAPSLQFSPLSNES